MFFLPPICLLKQAMALLEALKLPPVLNLEMRLGEGTGACILMGLIGAAAKILGEMATFESAGVEKPAVRSFSSQRCSF